MILDTTTKSLQILLSAPVSGTQLPCVATWADITSATFTPGSSDTQSNGTTAVTIVAAPAASTQRQVKAVSVYNADNANATVTVRLNSNSTFRTIVSVTLQPGWTLQYGENAWSVIGSGGSLSQASASSASGSDGEIQFNDGGNALGADSDLTWDKTANALALSGSTPNIQLTASTSAPAAPPSGTLSLFGRRIAGRMMTAQVGPSGLNTSLQPLLARNKIGYWNPPGNANTVPGVFGITAPSTQGTVTARNVAVTNLATRMRRLGYVSAATAGSMAEARVAAAQFSAGSGANDGSGFFFIIRWVPSDAATVAGERNFVGLTNATNAATNVEPSSLTNCIGIAQLSTDSTQLHLVYGGSAAQTPIALGTNFPGATLSTTAYELAIFAPNSVANTFYYEFTNISTGNSTSGTLTGTSVQIPQSTTLLAIRAWASNNATALAVGFDICSIYVETDN